MPAWTPLDLRLRRNCIEDENGCWRWQGEKRTGGYGYIEIDRKAKRVHRVAYEEWIGPIADNNDDMRAKGRDSKPPRSLCVPSDRCAGLMQSRTSQECMTTRPMQTGRGRTGPRKTHCGRGHLLPAYEPGKRRRCLTCENEQQRLRRGTRGMCGV